PFTGNWRIRRPWVYNTSYHTSRTRMANNETRGIQETIEDGENPGAYFSRMSSYGIRVRMLCRHKRDLADIPRREPTTWNPAPRQTHAKTIDGPVNSLVKKCLPRAG